MIGKIDSLGETVLTAEYLSENSTVPAGAVKVEAQGAGRTTRQPCHQTEPKSGSFYANDEFYFPLSFVILYLLFCPNSVTKPRGAGRKSGFSYDSPAIYRCPKMLDSVMMALALSTVPDWDHRHGHGNAHLKSMISNERRWPSQRPAPRPPQPYRERPTQPVPPRPPETTLASRELQIERKHFVILLRENARGRFIRIIEEVPGKSSTIIVPVTGLQDFEKLLDEMVKANADIPAKVSQPPASV
jgi:hypothetical protein